MKWIFSISACHDSREHVQESQVLDRSSSRRKSPHRVSGLAADGQPQPQLPHARLKLVSLSAG